MSNQGRPCRVDLTNALRLPGWIPGCLLINPRTMEQFLPLIEAIVVIVAFGSAAIIVETFISIIKSFKS